MSGLVSMNITGYSNGTFSDKISGEPYAVMINPATINLSRSISYTASDTAGQGAASPKFNKSDGGKLSFDLIIDCTGVVDITRINLSSELKKLRKIVYDYNGTEHRSNFVSIRWGSDLVFYGVLTNFDVSYTFFKSDGSPLRAKVSLKFDSYIDPKTEAKKEDKSSPDMTHLVSVVSGDTLPGLTHKTYGDSSHYIKLAKFNGLNKFRKLRGSTELVFPPIVQRS